MESVLQRKIQRWVSNEGGKVEKIHGSEFSESGSPDLLGAIPHGDGFIHFRVETKGSGKPSKIQLYRLKEWSKLGFWTTVVYSLEEFIEKLEEEKRARA